MTTAQTAAYAVTVTRIPGRRQPVTVTCQWCGKVVAVEATRNVQTDEGLRLLCPECTVEAQHEAHITALCEHNRYM